MAVQNIFEAVLGFDADRVAQGVTEELKGGTDLSRILNDGLIRAMDEVGRRFAVGDYFLPEMLQATRAIKAGMEVLRPHIASGSGENRGTVVIATVKGDLHDIGKNLVAMMLEGAGFSVVNLGVDVDAKGFLRAASENAADIVCISALLTTTMPAMAETVRLLAERCPGTRTMIGGAPVTRAFAERVGATAYAADAPEAVEQARRIMMSG